MKRKESVPVIVARQKACRWEAVEDLKVEASLFKALQQRQMKGNKRQFLRRLYDTIHMLYAPGKFFPLVDIHSLEALEDDAPAGQCEYFLEGIPVYLVFNDGWFWLSGEEWFAFETEVVG
jgi:hypothetical protein